MIQGRITFMYILGILIIIFFIIILLNGNPYKTKDFERTVLNSKLKELEINDSSSLLTSSSLVDVKYIHSGNLKVKLANPLNLKHPLCSEMENKEIQIPIFAYLLHHKKYGYFLLDSGCSSSYVDNDYGNMRGCLLPFVMPKTELVASDAIENQLSKDVLNNINAVFFTHLHMDHTSGLSALPENTTYIAGKGEKSYSIKWILEANHIKKNDTVFILDFDKQTTKTFPIGKAIDIFGDQSFWAISTPGHSKGHISYLVNQKDRPILIAGDACILNKSFEMGVASGTSSANLEQDQKTLDKIIQFIKENPNVELWCGHDFPR